MAPQETRTYLITAVTAGRRGLFRATAAAELFLETVQDYRQKKKFELYAYVVMPDHVHLLLTPSFDVPLEKAVQLIKGGFSFRLKGRLEVWERGYDNRRIVDSAAYDACVHYIHQNPVKKMLCEQPVDYPFSSAASHASVDPKPAWFQGRG